MKSNFVLILKINTTLKTYDFVLLCVVKPKRAAIEIGLIRVDGNGYSERWNRYK